MTVEIISWSISTKVWDRAGIELATPGSAVRHASVARHVTDCATRPGDWLDVKNGRMFLINNDQGFLPIFSASPIFFINPGLVYTIILIWVRNQRGREFLFYYLQAEASRPSFDWDFYKQFGQPLFAFLYWPLFDNRWNFVYKTSLFFLFYRIFRLF